MFESLRRYVWERRRGLATTAGFLGGLYIFGQYVFRRLDEMRDKVMQERAARENLRKRFQQNQEDCTYHVLALLPTLGNAILEEMDVERITLALQQTRNAVSAPSAEQSLLSNTYLGVPPQSTLLSDSIISEATSGSSADGSSISNPSAYVTNNIEHSPSAHRRDSSISTSASHSGQLFEPSFDTSGLISSSSDWVREFHSHQVQSRSSAFNGSPTSSAEARLSDSVSGTSISLVTDESFGDQSGMIIDSNIPGASLPQEDVVPRPPPPPPPAPLSNKTKVELWREMKILAFTRALTILYSLTLLSLLTHIQLNLIGTRKYVESVRQIARQADSENSGAPSISSLFWVSHPIFDSRNDEEEEEVEPMTEELERKYLTMSWWLLNVGWKDVAGRVREAVEHVFQSISLKSNIGPRDVEKLVAEVRQRVEYQDPDGKQRVNFLKTLVPLNEMDQEFVLLQGGLASHHAHIDEPLRSLLSETSTFVSSADFGIVLGLCLDRGTAMFLDGLRESVFGMGDHGQKIEFDEQSSTVRFAALLPAVARWSHLAVNGIPNELIEGLADMPEMTAFSAVLFSSFSSKLH